MFVPIAYAATSIPIIGKINQFIINPLISLLIAVAIVMFAYGVWESMSPDIEKKTDGKNHMVWGVVGLFIMVSAIGILNVVCSTIGCN